LKCTVAHCYDSHCGKYLKLCTNSL
jgi:hypothetical protein